MTKPFRTAALLALAALPAAAFAQNSVQDSLLRAGDLVGGRLHAAPPRTARPYGAASTPRRAATATGSADPTLARLLHRNIDISHLPAADLATVYNQILDVTSEQGGSWSQQQWADVTGAVERLNSRYEALRPEIPLTERLKIRNLQGDYYSRKAAHTAKQRVNG